MRIRKIEWIVATLVVAGCGQVDETATQPDTPAVAIEKAAAFSEVVLAAPEPSGPVRVLSGSRATQVVYVNFEGPTITDCNCSDARSNQSLVIGQVFGSSSVDFAPYTSSSGRTTILANLRTFYAGYNVVFTTQRPSSGDYTMVVISPTTGPHHGVAPQNCDNSNPNDIAFVHKIGSTSADTISRYAAHELGHSFGLAHVVDSTDIMQWASSGRAFERSTLDLSTAHSFGSCVPSGDVQDEPVMLTSALGPVLPETWNGRFADDDDSIFESAIEKIAAAGITQGCGIDPPRYCPADTVTRGQMAAFLKRALSLPAATADHFADDDGSLFEDAINSLAESGITQGCGVGRYCPNDAVTRGQMAVFLTRALSLPPASADYFVDDAGKFYESSANRMYEASITQGCPAPRYCGDDPVTRGQMAAFLARALGL